MFWSGNYIVVRELNSLLKEEDVTLTQVLEADDILQECKADNKALIQFLTRPEILAELITLITEEPPKNLELASQYRHASIACEVLTSRLATLSDRLSLDTVQMNRLCDFLNQDPPLNPLLASYFSKTVEMLLDRSAKQDCYLYHIVCLRVLDFFVARRDFLPNLLRHIATSAIADTFKYFIRLDDVFSKMIIEWLDNHQFLDNLIHIICGTYIPEEYYPPPDDHQPVESGQQLEKGQSEPSEKTEVNDKTGDVDGCKSDIGKVNNVCHDEVDGDAETKADSISGSEAEIRAERIRAVASANAAGLLWDLVLSNECTSRSVTMTSLVGRLQSEGGVRALLQAVFTSSGVARRHALVNGCQLLLALLTHHPILGGEGCEEERSSVELALAPHIPLLHQALLHAPGADHEEHVGHAGHAPSAQHAVGAARVHVAALLAQLAVSEVEEVPNTMLALGTPGVLVDMFFSHPNNNFLHAQVYALVKAALNNRLYCTQYAQHFFVECDLLTRLMDVYEENETKSRPRAAYMGHVVCALRRVAAALEPSSPVSLGDAVTLPESLLRRWSVFIEEKLHPVLLQHDTPLGGYYPSEYTYEVENMVDPIETNYELSDMAAAVEVDDMVDEENNMCSAMNSFLDLVKQRGYDDEVWDDQEASVSELPEYSERARHSVDDVLAVVSPWESGTVLGDTCTAGGGEAEVSSDVGEGWAQFGAAFEECPDLPASPPAPALPADAASTRAPPAAHTFSSQDFPPWGYSQDERSPTDAVPQPVLDENQPLEADHTNNSLDDLTTELANNLRTAMSSMSSEAIASIINANLSPQTPLLAATTNVVPTTTTEVKDISQDKNKDDNSER